MPKYPADYKPQHRTLTIHAVEHRPRGDRHFARDERQASWRTFKPTHGWECFAGAHHEEVWMADFGNTRIYTCAHEATIIDGPKINVRPPVGD
jgi:hypothetical protein